MELLAIFDMETLRLAVAAPSSKVTLLSSVHCSLIIALNTWMFYRVIEIENGPLDGITILFVWLGEHSSSNGLCRHHGQAVKGKPLRLLHAVLPGFSLDQQSLIGNGSPFSIQLAACKRADVLSFNVCTSVVLDGMSTKWRHLVDPYCPTYHANYGTTVCRLSLKSISWLFGVRKIKVFINSHDSHHA